MKVAKPIRIRKGQVWRRKLDARNKNDRHLVLITQGGDSIKGKRIDKPRIQHHFKKKSLLLFYDLIGTENNHE